MLHQKEDQREVDVRRERRRREENGMCTGRGVEKGKSAEKKGMG